MAFAARDADAVVDLRLAVFVEVDCILRAVHIASASHASTAEVRDLVVGLYTRGAGLVHHTHYVTLDMVAACERLPCIIGERSQLVFLVAHIEAEEREHLVFPNGALLMDAAAATRLSLTWAEIDWKVVDLFDETVVAP